MKEISKYAFFLSGILAFVLSITAILFLILALLVPSYIGTETSTYFLIAGIILTVIAVIFISGLNILKKNKHRGVNFIIGGSILFILACIVPTVQLTLSLPGFRARAVVVITTLILYFPFAWLIAYLWRLKKKSH